MNQDFKNYIEREYNMALIREFVYQTNNGTLDTSNYTEDSLETLMFVHRCLQQMLLGIDPLS